ncbi:MAG: cytochrome c oxidase assembly protein [Chloroflexota bacterium]|nr:cytochrome c oxidase assembly protein [Chloroflexota bacterium]
MTVWPIGISLVLFSLAMAYGRGWQRLRAVQPTVANPARLVLFCVSLAALAAATLSPLDAWSGTLLIARALQKILLCMIAAPFFWLACGFHCMVWGLPTGWRKGITRLLHQRSPAHHLLRTLTQPGLTWLLFMSAFLLWHDPALVNRTMAQPALHHATLTVLFLTALLFWWHIVGSGPRIHPRFPAWISFAGLIGVEIPNIVAGITIAFAGAPVYDHYAMAYAAGQSRLPLTLIEDQMISGGMIWVFGSFTYFLSAVLVLNKIFRDHDGNSAQPFPDWDADARMIAPGLEHRVVENR